MRNEKGITLVALIFAVLVIVILAGISVAILISEGENEAPVNNTVIGNTSSDSPFYDSVEITGEGENEVQENQTAENEVSNEVMNEVTENVVGENIVNENTVENSITTNAVN